MPSSLEPRHHVSRHDTGVIGESSWVDWRVLNPAGGLISSESEEKMRENFALIDYSGGNIATTVEGNVLYTSNGSNSRVSYSRSSVGVHTGNG